MKFALSIWDNGDIYIRSYPNNVPNPVIEGSMYNIHGSIVIIIPESFALFLWLYSRHLTTETNRTKDNFVTNMLYEPTGNYGILVADASYIKRKNL